jgi:hypothetical protein
MDYLTHTIGGAEIEINDINADPEYGWLGNSFVVKTMGAVIAEYEFEVFVDRDLHRLPYASEVMMMTHDGRKPVPDYVKPLVDIAAELTISHVWGYVPQIQMEAAE